MKMTETDKLFEGLRVAEDAIRELRARLDNIEALMGQSSNFDTGAQKLAQDAIDSAETGAEPCTRAEYEQRLRSRDWKPNPDHPHVWYPPAHPSGVGVGNNAWVTLGGGGPDEPVEIVDSYGAPSVRKQD